MFEAMLLGTGMGRPDPKRFAPSNLLWFRDRPVLVDCGPGVTFRLRSAGVRPSQIGNVFVTHFHADHFFEFPWLNKYTIIMGNVDEAIKERGNMRFHGPPGSHRILKQLDESGDQMDDIAALGGYDKVREFMTPEIEEIYNGWTLDYGSWKVRASLVDHGDCKLPCFAFRFESGSKSVVFTGDTVGCENLTQLAKGADVMVHECNFPEEEVEARKRLGLAWWIHSTPTMAGEHAQAARVKKLVLNHFVGWDDFSPNKDPYDWEKIAPPRVKEHFDGEVILGEDLMKIEI